MSIERVRDYLKQFNMETRIQEFHVSSATVALAAEVLSVIPARIAKSLSFMVDGKAVVVVAAGDAKVDNTKYKAQFHTKAKMLTPEEAEALVGHAIGGICPFGVNGGVDIYLDISMQRFDTVFPAAGSANSAIEMTCEELFRCSGALAWVDVCKDWLRETI